MYALALDELAQPADHQDDNRQGEIGPREVEPAGWAFLALP